jgi:hypothetical protein
MRGMLPTCLRPSSASRAHHQPHGRGGDDRHAIAEKHGSREIARFAFEGEPAYGALCAHLEQGGKHLTLEAAGAPLLNDGGEAPEAVGAPRHGDLPPTVPSGPAHTASAPVAQL